MSSADVRDMLDLPSQDGRPRPAKKQKSVTKRPEGVTRELFTLMGERVPPVAVTSQVKYKEKPKPKVKAQSWEMAPFLNPAREDTLVLRHWRKKQDSVTDPPPATPAETPVGVNGATRSGTVDVVEAGEPLKVEIDQRFAKWNLKIDTPKFTEEEYKTHLQSDDWDMRETSYLIDLVLDFDLRWIVIADRYDYKPIESSSVPTNAAKQRSMEDMKERYYDVAAKLMALHHPPSTMSTSEFDLHESMTKFNPKQEIIRKELAEALFNRPPEETREEELLLGELKRIVTHEERFSQERKELYDRLDFPISKENSSTYQSSQGLNQLFQTLLNADKSKRHRSLTATDGGASSPAPVASRQSFGGQSDRPQRESIGGASIKKGSISGASQRTLTAREEAKFGVSHPDRITSGVSFRSEKITKLNSAKSATQAGKIQAAVVELGLPLSRTMVTAKVVAEYERLIQGIHAVLDVTKISEKVDGEIKVLQAQKEGPKPNGAHTKDKVTPPRTSEAAAGSTPKNEEEDNAKAEDEDDNSDTDDDDVDAERDADTNVDEQKSDGNDDDEDDDNSVDARAEADADIELANEEKLGNGHVEEGNSEGDSEEVGDEEEEDDGKEHESDPKISEDEDDAGKAEPPLVAPNGARAGPKKRSASQLSGSDKSAKRQRT